MQPSQSRAAVLAPRETFVALSKGLFSQKPHGAEPNRPALWLTNRSPESGRGWPLSPETPVRTAKSGIAIPEMQHQIEVLQKSNTTHSVMKYGFLNSIDIRTKAQRLSERLSNGFDFTRMSSLNKRLWLVLHPRCLAATKRAWRQHLGGRGSFPGAFWPNN